MPESNAFIPVSDGVRLAATLYLPDTDGPWPALLEAYPYRKDDLSVYADSYRRLRDEGDFAVCRLDTRGTGSSEGVATAEYPPQEGDDLCEVIAWLAQQPWCTGAVGMFGTSYSGFNSLQTAMRQPPALKAVTAIFATDDRYTDDVHFGGGVRKAMEFGYPLFMVSMNALPAVPSLAGPGWRERWLQRIDELEPWFGSIEEQNDGPFWRQGSVRPGYDQIRVPTMIVAGWSDVYRTALPRLYEHLTVPKRMVIGPWSHMGTDASIPGPRVDLTPELVRWFDRYLRGTRNGVETEPPVTVFVRRSTRPEPDLDAYRGRWRHEPEWPPARGRDRVREAAVAGRGGRPEHDGTETLTVRGDIGTTAHIRGTYYPPYGLAIDQRTDDVHSLTYDWPVAVDLEILGTPVLEATVRSSQPVAFLSARLCEVLPDGTSVLVSRGLLNLTHRRSHTAPEALVPGELYTVAVELDTTSWVFEAGNRIRLAIAGADWPAFWPPPRAAELTITVDQTRLVLPEMPGPDPIETPPALLAVADEPGKPTTRERAINGASWRIEHDVYARETRVVVDQDSFTELPDGSTARMTDRVRTGVDPAHPGHAWVESTSECEVVWPELTARTVARLGLRSDPATWNFDLTLEVFENGEPIASRHWQAVTPRALQ